MAQGLDVDTEVVSRLQSYLESTPEFAQGDAPEAPPPAPPPVTTPEPPPLSEEPPQAAQPEEAAEEAQPEAEASAEPAPEEDDATIDSLGQLAEAYEMSVDEFAGALLVEGRNGENVPLQEVINSYRSTPADTNELREQVRSEYEVRDQEREKTHSKAIDSLTDMTKRLMAQNEVIGEPPPELRNENPSEYLRMLEIHQAQQGLIRNAIEQIDSEMARVQREQQEQASKRKEQWDAEQRRLLKDFHPEWSDRDNGVAAASEINKYMRRMGFSDEQIENLEDARAVSTVWKAAQWDNLIASRPEAKKKIRGVPRVIRGGARKPLPEPTAEADAQRQAARERLAESGKVEDAALLFRDLID
jgi:hypothetical protein